MEQQIKAKHPFIAQSVRIKVFKIKRESICLRAEVHGCRIPRGKSKSFLDSRRQSLSPSLPYDRFTKFDGSAEKQLTDMEV